MAPRSIERSCIVYRDIWSFKNELKPEEVAISSDKKYWFDCKVCNHDYDQTPANKTNGQGCPYCVNKSLCGILDCENCLPKTCYLYKDIWSSRNKLRPEEVAISSCKKYWFDCKDCPHDYDQSPNGKSNGRGCPFCVKYNGKICGNLDCSFCLPKSCYIYRDIWSINNKVKPEHVPISCNIKYLFKCGVCPHDYKQSPGNKTHGRGCPYCATPSKKLCGTLECTFCLNRSCYIYRYIWGSKNKLRPEEVAISSNKKFWFNCIVCLSNYEQIPNSKSRGRGCPTCVNKTEKMVIDFLKEFFIVFISQFRLNSNKRYDFCFPEYKLIIEIDGDQHFRQVSNWCCPEITLQNDIQKMKIAFENGYSVLRIYQPDIWNDNIDWRQAILNNMYLRTIPSVTYFSSNPEIYSRHSF